MDEIQNSITVVRMKPVCTCGHVFRELKFNKLKGFFLPESCPACNRVIQKFEFEDLESKKPDENGIVTII